MEEEETPSPSSGSKKYESSPLNVLCGICNEFYTKNDIIFSTSCGHVFHKECLTRWLYRSQTCPQCRTVSHRNRIHRIFLNFSERTEVDYEEPPKLFIQWVPINLDVHSTTCSYQPPEGAVPSGTDDEGNETYVARAYLNEDLLPAAYAPLKKVAQAPWNCKGHTLTEEVDILVLSNCDYSWVPEENGRYPPNALQTGYSEMGEVLYTARGTHEGISLLGKLHPSHRVVYMPYREQEVNSHAYEVLTVTPKEQTDR